MALSAASHHQTRTSMDLEWSAKDRAFRDEVRTFLDRTS